jgi:hypothetical protein
VRLVSDNARAIREQVRQNLINTGITGGKGLLVLDGQRKALGIAARLCPPACA